MMMNIMHHQLEEKHINIRKKKKMNKRLMQNQLKEKKEKLLLPSLFKEILLRKWILEVLLKLPLQENISLDKLPIKEIWICTLLI